MYTLTKPLFGKETEILLPDADPLLASPIAEDAYQEGLRLQHVFNFYDPQSELSLLNGKRTLTTSPELTQVLKLAISLAKATEGRYDISLGKQFLQRKQGTPVTPVGCSYRDISINGNTVTLTHPDVLIDLGSIAKGFIGDRMMAALAHQGVTSATVDARGDLCVIGKDIIDIQHPRDASKIIASIQVNDCGVATSGDYLQYDKTFDKSHILNAKKIASVTVVAPTLMEADAFATVLFVIDDAERKQILAAYPAIRALIIDTSLTMQMYNDFERLLA